MLSMLGDFPQERFLVAGVGHNNNFRIFDAQLHGPSSCCEGFGCSEEIGTKSGRAT
jgi:hypothetical protein